MTKNTCSEKEFEEKMIAEILENKPIVMFDSIKEKVDIKPSDIYIFTGSSKPTTVDMDKRFFARVNLKEE